MGSRGEEKKPLPRKEKNTNSGGDDILIEATSWPNGGHPTGDQSTTACFAGSMPMLSRATVDAYAEPSRVT